MKTGYILLGHGSRAQEANAAFLQMVELVQEKLAVDTVSGAFMDHSQPDLEEAATGLIKRGCVQLVIMPFFLYPGIHLQEDIPALVNSLQEKFGPAIAFKLTKHLGVDARLAEIVLDRIKEV